MDVFDYYQTAIHAKPYSHQFDTYKALEVGQSVILRAPTGSGKSEAVFLPYTIEVEENSTKDYEVVKQSAAEFY